MSKLDEADCLEAVQISSPCNVPWDTMPGNERVRHCGACRQNVYNVAALPRKDALRLIGGSEGRLCLRILRRPDGTVVTADCFSRLRAARRRGWWALACALVVVGWAQLTAMWTGFQGLQRALDPREEGEYRLGGLEIIERRGPAAITVDDEGGSALMGEMVGSADEPADDPLRHLR